MAITFDDHARTLDLSVRDLIAAAPPSGHLVLDVVQTSAARFAAGREVHTSWQAEQAAASGAYRAEVTVRHTFEAAGWTVRLSGRVDGLVEEDGHTLVEEIKSTALDERRLYNTTPADWPAWTEQLDLYLWMLHASGRPAPEGRLVLISVLDGSRCVLGVRLDAARVADLVLRRTTALVQERERRRIWLSMRHGWEVPWPFAEWRSGQRAIAEAVRTSLDEGRRLLVQAPTGLGKTIAVAHGALRHALASDRRIFWATARNTQQAAVVATLTALRDAGLPLTWVTLRAREKMCINDTFACRPDVCPHARDYHDRLAACDAIPEALAGGGLSAEQAMELGRRYSLCPAQLAADLAPRVDVVVGDMNYALMPEALPPSVTWDGPGEIVIIADEAHQVVDRARDQLGPSVQARAVRAAQSHLQAGDAALAPFAELADDILQTLLDAVHSTPGPFDGGQAEAQLLLEPWRRLSRRVDELAFDYALVKARTSEPGTPDPWLDLARTVLRFARCAELADEGTRALVQIRPGEEHLRLLCLDPSTRLRPHLAAYGGLIGCSATLTPAACFRDLLGLPEDTGHLDLPTPFDPARRPVWTVAAVSTRWRHRDAQAERLAALLRSCAEAVPGNVIVYLPSFQMLSDVAALLPAGRHEVVVQRPSLSEVDRQRSLSRLVSGSTPALLMAVLGGIFAEGIDLPPGAVDAIFVVGPGLPPTGLERTLLRQSLEERFGHGFLYASVIPGMIRVVQACGRLIRRPEDRGAIVLFDDRFQQRPFTTLMPADWGARATVDPAAELAAFFGGSSEDGALPSPDEEDDRPPF